MEKNRDENRADYYRHNMSMEPSSVSEVMPVPPELKTHVLDAQFQPCLLKIKQQTGIHAVSVTSTGTDNVSIMIDSPDRERAVHARQLVELHFRHQARLTASEARLAKVQQDLFSTQGNMASGLIVEFEVDKDLVGLVIGKGGARLEKVKKDCGIASIRTRKEKGKVFFVIAGNTPQAVKKAREAMEISLSSMPLSTQTYQYLLGHIAPMMDLKETTGLASVYLEAKTSSIVFVGTASSLRSANLLIESLLEDVRQLSANDEKEKELMNELYGYNKKMGNVRGYQGNNARPNSGGQSAGQRRVSNNGPLPKPPAVAPKDKKANPLLPAPAATKKDSGSRTAESTVNSTVNSTGGSNKNAKSKEMTQSSAGSTISTMEGDSKDAPPKSSKRRNRKNKGGASMGSDSVVA